MAKKNDPINHPAHYTKGKIEVIDFIEDQKFGYLKGNAIKYISRSSHKKKELEDLRKAAWYLNRKIQNLCDESYLSPSCLGKRNYTKNGVIKSKIKIGSEK